MKTKFYFILVLIIFSSCTMAPDYKRPEVNVPLTKTDETKINITTIFWDQFFQSQDLQNVIRIALQNNRDLIIANLNMESALQTHNIVRSSLLPNLEGVVGQLIKNLQLVCEILLKKNNIMPI